jgi:hypothetical protein
VKGLAAQRDEEEDGGEAVQHLTGLQLTLPSDTHIRAQECSVPDPDPGWVKSKDPDPG